MAKSEHGYEVMLDLTYLYLSVSGQLLTYYTFEAICRQTLVNSATVVVNSHWPGRSKDELYCAKRRFNEVLPVWSPRACHEDAIPSL
jgi:hypothetical protein